MATYEYSCEKCGVFEISQKMSDAPLKTCPTCSGAVHRLLSATPFHLKGGGWYKTDYGSGSSNGRTSSDSPKAEDTKSEDTKATDSKEKVSTEKKDSDSTTCPPGGCGKCDSSD